MRQKWKYLGLEMKSAFACMVGVLIGFLLMLSLLFLLLFAAQKVAEQKEEDQRIVMGVVLPNDDEVMEKLIGFANNLTSLKGICRLSVCSKEEAKEAILDGRMQMLMVIPEGFYEAANRMEPAEFELYVPEHKNASEKKIIAMLGAAEQVMAVTEGAITSMYQGMERYTFSFTRAEMENAITSLYVKQFMGRMNAYEVTFVSLYGNYSFVEYYGVSLGIISLLVCSIGWMSLYAKEEMYLEHIISRSFAGEIGLVLRKLMSMAVPLFLLISGALFAIGGMLSADSGDLGKMQADRYAVIFFIAISIVLYLHVLAVMVSEKNRRQIYFLVTLLMAMLSGGLFPRAYFPEWLRTVSVWFPFSKWHSLLLDTFWGKLSGRSVWEILLQDLVLFLLGMYFYHKQLEKTGH